MLSREELDVVRGLGIKAASTIAKIAEPMLATLNQFNLVTETVHELAKQSVIVNNQARHAEEEIKTQPDNLYYIRERSRRIGALTSEDSKCIMAKNKEGKLTLPKVPTFDELFLPIMPEVITCKKLICKLMSEADAKDINGEIDRVLEIYRKKLEELTDYRKELVKVKNAMIRLGQENEKIAGRLAGAAAKRAEELIKNGDNKFLDNLSEAEAAVVYAELTAKTIASACVMDEKAQATLAEFKLPLMALPATVDLDTAVTRIASSFVAPARTSTASATAALSIAISPTLSRSHTPPSSDESSGSDEESKGHTPPSPSGTVRTVTSSPSRSPDITPPSSPDKSAEVKERSTPSSSSSYNTSGHHAGLHGAELAKARMAAAEAQRQKDLESEKLARASSSGPGKRRKKCVIQ
jgi:hypothetical protein